MRRIQPPAARSGLVAPATVVFFIVTLYLGQDLLIPFALAVLLSFLLSPLVSPLQRWFGRTAAVLMVVMLMFGTVGGIGWVVTEQILSLARELPGYKGNLDKKIQSLQRGMGGQPFTRAAETLEQLERQLQAGPVATVELSKVPDGTTHAAVLPGTGPMFGPIPVRVVEPPSSLMQALPAMLGPLLGPAATGGVVLVLLVFMLLKREDLRNRFIRLIGQSQLSGTTQALDDAASRVSRYLLMQLLINATYGLPVAVGLWFIGVPNAVLWGVLATLLRFVPFLGPVLGAGMPILLSLAVFDGWRGPLLTIGLFAVLELISNNAVEPWLYGSSTGISSMALIVAALFWTWLWGPVGLILATPLTVCLAVMGRHVPQLDFLNIVLSDEESLSPGERYYQRLLATDKKEANQLVQQCLQTQSLVGVYDGVLIPALCLAEQDHHREVLDEPRLVYFRQSLRDLVEELGDDAEMAKDARAPDAAAEPDAPTDVPDARRLLRVLCLPAKDDADEIVGEMLGQLVESRGYSIENMSVKSLSGEMLQLVGEIQADAVVVSVLPPLTLSHARFLCKRIHARYPLVKIVVGLWNTEAPLVKARQRLRAAGADAIVTTLQAALEQLERYELDLPSRRAQDPGVELVASA